MTLHAEDGPAYAVLTGLSDDAATLRIGGAAHTVPLGALAQVWRGDFATFWRAPPGFVGRVGTRRCRPGGTVAGRTPRRRARRPRETRR